MQGPAAAKYKVAAIEKLGVYNAQVRFAVGLAEFTPDGLRIGLTAFSHEPKQMVCRYPLVFFPTRIKFLFFALNHVVLWLGNRMRGRRSY